MQIINTNVTRLVADRNPDMVETKDRFSAKIITAKSITENLMRY
jgi:hypothetical protein